MKFSISEPRSEHTRHANTHVCRDVWSMHTHVQTTCTIKGQKWHTSPLILGQIHVHACEQFCVHNASSCKTTSLTRERQLWVALWNIAQELLPGTVRQEEQKREGDKGDLRPSWAWHAQHRKARGTSLREAALVSELLERSLAGC